MEWYRQLMDNAPEGSKRAVVHIGINKTGSTAIQAALFSARTRLLSEARILYPSIAANQSIHLWTMFREEPHPVLQRIEPDAVGEASVTRVRKRFFAALEEDFTNPDWDTLVISAEDLSRFYTPDVSRFIKWLIEHVNDIRVVAYARHPVDWTRSMVQEQLKQGETLDQVYENVPRPEWQLRFAPWLNAVGFERFHLVCFDEAREATDGIMASFCDAANLPCETILSLAPTVSKNESMSHEAALLVDSLNRQRPLYRDGKLSPERRWFGIDAMMTVPGNKFSLTPEQEAQARIVSRPDLRWLNDRFGTDLYPDVFEDRPLKEAVRVETMPQETVDALAIKLSNLGNALEHQKLRGAEADTGVGESDLEETLRETREQLKKAQRQANGFRRQLQTNGFRQQLNSLAREWVLWHIPPDGICVEIGVDVGKYSKQILDTAYPRELHLVDPWEHHESPIYEKSVYGGLGPEGQRVMDSRYEELLETFSEEVSEGRVRFHRAYSHVAATSFEPGYFDWVYIDANHQYEFVKSDLEAYYPLVKPGGFLCGDDYGEQGWWEVGVEDAVDEFVAEKGLELHTRHTQFVIFAR